MTAELYRCCEHCLNYRGDACPVPDVHRVPCSVMTCGLIDAGKQRVK